MNESKGLATSLKDTLSTDPLLGTPYTFVRRLGEGAMGEVVEAEHLALGHRVAVKLLRVEHYSRFDLKDRMRLEAQTCARIRDDHLVLVTDCGETLDGRVFVVMELLRGRTLAEEVKRLGSLTWEEAANIAMQALSGLSVVHEAGLVHRDIKPDNLFLCDRGAEPPRVKVLDFGIAKIVDSGKRPETPAPLAEPTAAGIAVGTPRYASPEQARGEQAVDRRSDLYSMGLMLHWMLTGQVPFAEKMGHRELLRAHEQDVLPLPSKVAPFFIPAELDRIVMKAVAKRPGDRYQEASTFKADLAALKGQHGVAAAAPLGMVATVALGPTMSALVMPQRAPTLATGSPKVPRVTTQKSRKRKGQLGLVAVCGIAVFVGVTLAILLRWVGVW